MTRIWNFPTVPVSKQLFHVPGAAMEGGFTSGAVRLLSPEPGGRAVLELQIATQVREWLSPVSSWLMSKGNGEVFRIRLAPTPQVFGARAALNGVPWKDNVLWAGNKSWQGDTVSFFVAPALEGSGTVKIAVVEGLQPGHVIGHGNTTYLIDEIDVEDGVATIAVKPPVRYNIAVDDTALLRPFFTGTIANIGEVRATYDASDNGMIQPGKFIFSEAIS